MRILVAEDDPVSRRLLESYMAKWGYEAVVASDGAEAWEKLQAADAPRLALLDWMMPEMDGVEVCRRVRQRAQQPYTYVLLLTAKDDKLDVIEGLESGADDYLTKPFHPQELKARLRVGKRILDLEDGLLAAREVLQFKATHDQLTGLWNRGAILDTLHRELARSRRDSTPVGVLLADLDHFKSINDIHGHLAGDQVLRETARRLTDSVRIYDTVGRYGGEEFLIIVPGCNELTTRTQAERLRTAIGTVPVKTTEGAIPITVSIGAVAASGEVDADVNADALVRAADAALYRAKAAGRNRVELATRAETEVPARHVSPEMTSRK